MIVPFHVLKWPPPNPGPLFFSREVVGWVQGFYLPLFSNLANEVMLEDVKKYPFRRIWRGACLFPPFFCTDRDPPADQFEGSPATIPTSLRHEYWVLVSLPL